MEMSIDESIRVISYVKPKKPTSPSGMLKKNAFNTAIETMRKYQKIQEILNSTGYIEKGIVYAYTYDENSRVKHIREVVEDGTN